MVSLSNHGCPTEDLGHDGLKDRLHEYYYEVVNTKTAISKDTSVIARLDRAIQRKALDSQVKPENDEQTKLCHNTYGRISNSFIFLGRPLLFAMLLAISCFGCSLPKIIVLADPLSPEEHLNLGVAYERNGELDSAIKEYEAASKKLAVAYLYIGNVYFQKKDYENAESNFRKAIRKDPKNADAYNNLAWLYYIKEINLEEAEALASKAIDLNPSKADTYRDTLEKIRDARKSH